MYMLPFVSILPSQNRLEHDFVPICGEERAVR